MKKALLTLAVAAAATLAAGGSPAQADTVTTTNWAQTTTPANWNVPTNWSAGVPNSTTVQAQFLASSGFLDSGTFTVDVDIPITVAGIFNNNVPADTGTIAFNDQAITFNNTTTSNSNEALLEAASATMIFTNNIINNDPDGISIQPFKQITINGTFTSSSHVDLTTGTLVLGSAGNSIDGIVMSAHSSAVLEATNPDAFSGITGTVAFTPNLSPGGNANGGGQLTAGAAGATTLNAALDFGNSSGNISFFAFNAVGSVFDITTNSISNADGTGQIRIVGGGNALDEFSGTGFTIAEPVVFNAGNLELAPASGTQTWSGNFSNTNSGNVTIGGGGTVILSGDNTYTGQTDITAGTLLLNGTHITAASSQGIGTVVAQGNFQVESGGTLGGTGRIEVGTTISSSNAVNAILVKSGGFVAPGSNGIGALTLDAGNFKPTGTGPFVYLNMASGSAFNFDLDGSGGTPDQVNLWNYVNGNLGLNANALNLDLVGTQAAGTYTVSLFQFFGDSGTTATASDISSGLTLGTLGAGIDSASIIYNADSIDLQYTVAGTPVPEPASLALLGLGALGLLARRRKERAD